MVRLTLGSLRLSQIYRALNKTSSAHLIQSGGARCAISSCPGCKAERSSRRVPCSRAARTTRLALLTRFEVAAMSIAIQVADAATRHFANTDKVPRLEGDFLPFRHGRTRALPRSDAGYCASGPAGSNGDLRDETRPSPGAGPHTFPHSYGCRHHLLDRCATREK